MNVIVVLIAYNEHLLIRKSIESMFVGTKHNLKLYLYLSSFYNNNLVNECDKLSKEFDCSYFPIGKNELIAYANEGFYNGYFVDNSDLVVCTSPDIIFDSSSEFDKFLDKAVSYKDSRFMISSITHLHDYFPYACCIITKFGLKTVGYNDENLTSGYGDTDWNRRAALITGENPSFISSKAIYREEILTNSKHVSKNFKRNGALQSASVFNCATQLIVAECITAPLSKSYYIKKWGGDFPNEQFARPFNDYSLGLSISYSQRKNPYPQYKRKNKIFIDV